MVIVKSTFGSRLAGLRKESGLSCRELAELAGVSNAYPSLIEAGKRPRVGTDIAERIAGIFGATMDYLVSNKGRAPTRAQIKAAVEAARARGPSKRKGKAAA